MKSGLLAISLALLLTPACRRSTAGSAASVKPAQAAAVTPAPVAAPEPAPPRGTQVTLLYSSNLNGEYEPCG